MALDAGSVYVDLLGRFKGDDFRKYDRAVADAEKQKKVETELKGDYDPKGFKAFDAALKKARAERDVTVNLRARAETSGITRFLSMFRGVRRELGRGVQHKMSVQADTSGIGKFLGAWRSVQSAVSRRSVKSVMKVDADTSGVSRFAVAVGAANGMLQGFNNRMQAVRNASRLLILPGAIAGVGLLAQAAGAAVTGLTALAGSMGVGLVGAATAGAGGMVALAQGFGVAKLALGGVGEALAGNKEAFKRLTPVAKDFVRMLRRDFGPALKDIRQTAQRNMFPGLTEGLKSASRNLPVFKRLVAGTAEALGDLAHHFGLMVGGRQFGRDLEAIGKSNIVVLRNLGAAALTVVSAFRHIGVAAAPMIARVSKDVYELSVRLDDAAENGRKTGALGAFFDRAYNRLRATWHVARDFGQALLNIASIGDKAIGRDLLGSLEKASAGFRRFTESPGGRNRIAEHFRESKPAIEEMGRLVRDVSATLLRLGRSPHLAPLINQIRTQMLPAVEQLIASMTKNVGPPMVRLFTSLARLAAEMGPTVGMVVGKLADLASAVTRLIQKVPALKALVAAFITLGAVRMVGAITGITSLIGLLGRVAVAYRTAGAAAAASALFGGAGAAGVGGAAAGGAGMGALLSRMRAFIPLGARVGGTIAALVTAGIEWDKVAHRGSGRTKALNRELDGQTNYLKRLGQELGLIGRGEKSASQQHRERAAALEKATRATIGMVRETRAMSGLTPILGQHERAVANMVGRFSHIPNVMRLVSTGSREAVGHLGVLAQGMNDAGRGKFMGNVLRDAPNVNQAIRRVEREVRKLAGVKLTRKVIEILSRGGPQTMNWLIRLGRTKFGRKLLEIINRGGPEAARQLRAIANTKLGRKLLQIIERGGKNADAIVRALQNRRIRNKLFGIIQKGGSFARNVVRGLENHKIRNKIFKILANNALTAAQQARAVAREVNAIPRSKTVNILVRYSHLGRKVKFAEGGFNDSLPMGGGAIGGALGVGGPDDRHVKVAGGEAFLTRFQQAWADKAFAVAKAVGASPFGSLMELFSGERRPHGGVASGQGFATGGMIQAEDGSWVPPSFYGGGQGGGGGKFQLMGLSVSMGGSGGGGGGLIQAEDGSWVPPSFYARGGIVPSFAKGGRVQSFARGGTAEQNRLRLGGSLAWIRSAIRGLHKDIGPWVDDAERRYSQKERFFSITEETFVTPENTLNTPDIEKRLTELRKLLSMKVAIRDLLDERLFWARKAVKGYTKAIARAKQEYHRSGSKINRAAFQDRIRDYRTRLDDWKARAHDSPFMMEDNRLDQLELLSQISPLLSQNRHKLLTGEAGGGDPGSGGTDNQALIDQLRQRLELAETIGRIARGSLAVFSGSGDIGVGAQNALLAARMHSGGLVPGDVPVLGQSGEWMNRRGAVQRYGPDFFAELDRRADGVPGRASPNETLPLIVQPLQPVSDQRILALVGNLATAGQAQQGYRPAKREHTGA